MESKTPSRTRKTSADKRAKIYNALTKSLTLSFPDLPPACQVQMLPIDAIVANQYNPNCIAQPELQLLKHSIESSGITMPLLVKPIDGQRYELIDGFHRFEILTRHPHLQTIPGYAPAILLSLSDDACMSTSVRHNVARGVHLVELTAKLLIQLKRCGWSDEKIGQELGMDKDEILRLKQSTGLCASFKQQTFSQAWE